MSRIETKHLFSENTSPNIKRIVMMKRSGIPISKRDEEKLRINAENQRLKEWEKKFDHEQKIKEEALLEKFYNDKSKDESKEENAEKLTDNIEKNDLEINKNN